MNETGPSLGKSSYHYGLIVPVTRIELTAALWILDKRNKCPYDFNDEERLKSSKKLKYHFGTIGKYHVVIASMTPGRPGTGYSAAAASTMKSDFPDIRFYFLAGIAGGIPHPSPRENSMDDIHLGDVVVGCSSMSGIPSVVQYDLNRIQHDRTQNISLLDSTDSILSNTAVAVISQLQRHGAENNDAALVYSTLLQKSQGGDARHFKRPNPGLDQLYQSDYIHEVAVCKKCLVATECSHNNGRPCRHCLTKIDCNHVSDKPCQDCNRERLVKRTAREYNRRPAFHEGQIASGGELIELGKRRDQIAKEFPLAKCVEMEAAGVASVTPCLVVRGISDYADSHRNHEWSNYAAAMAMVFIKVFLNYESEVATGENPSASTTATRQRQYSTSNSKTSDSSTQESVLDSRFVKVKKHLDDFKIAQGATKKYIESYFQTSFPPDISAYINVEQGHLQHADEELNSVGDTWHPDQQRLYLMIQRGFVDVWLAKARGEIRLPSPVWETAFSYLDIAEVEATKAQSFARSKELDRIAFAINYDLAFIYFTRAVIGLLRNKSTIWYVGGQQDMDKWIRQAIINSEKCIASMNAENASNFEKWHCWAANLVTDHLLDVKAGDHHEARTILLQEERRLQYL